MAILGIPFIWSHQLICCLDFLNISIFKKGFFSYKYYDAKWLVFGNNNMCNHCTGNCVCVTTQVVVEQSSNWG